MTSQSGARTFYSNRSPTTLSPTPLPDYYGYSEYTVAGVYPVCSVPIKIIAVLIEIVGTLMNKNVDKCYQFMFYYCYLMF